MSVQLKVAFVALACLALLAAVSFFTVRLWLAHGNTPANRPDWKLTKALMPGISGIQDCMVGPQMYAGEQLNLGVWNGYHEVLYHEPLKLAKLSFRFQVDDRSYVSFIGYNSRSNFEAFRFSGWEDYRSAWISGKRTGRYTNLTTGSPAIFYPFQWHTAELIFANGQMKIVVDGYGITEGPTILTDLAQVGFRGGLGAAQVDDVVFETVDGYLISEDFSNRGDLVWRIGIVGGSLGIFVIVVLLLCRMKGRTWDSSLEMLFACASALLLLSVIAFYYYTMVLVTKEKPGSPEEVPSVEKIAQSVKETYAIDKQPGEVRILFLGTSQTWGEGAFDSKGNFVYFVGQYLPQLKPEVKSYVMNGATHADDVGQILPLYLDVYRDYKPDIVVLNLGAADVDKETLNKTLDDLAAMNNVDGVRTIFMLEARSPEDPRPTPENYKVMREVAEKNGVALVDANKFVGKKVNDGYLFWDYTHATNFGHDQIAQGLLPTLTKIIDELRPPAAPATPKTAPAPKVAPTPPTPRSE